MQNNKLLPSSHPALSKPVLRLQKSLVLNEQKNFDFSEIRFRRLVEHMNEAVWVGDRNEKTVYSNPKFCEITEYTLTEMLGRPSYDFWTPESAERVKAVNESDRKRGVSSSYEGELLTKSGRKIPVLLSGTPLPDGGTIGIMTDLREIKKKEEKMRVSENTYRAIFDNTGTAMIIIENDMTISYANAEFLKLAAASGPEVIGKAKWNEFFEHDGAELMERYHRVRRISPSAAPRSYEARFKDCQKNIRHVFMTVAMIPETKRSVASLIDITARKNAESQLRRHIREAQLLYQANGHMRMVHTIRQVFADIAKDMLIACREISGAHPYIEFDGRAFTPSDPKSCVRKVREPIYVRSKKRGVIEIHYSIKKRGADTVFNDDKKVLSALSNFVSKHVSSREIIERYMKLVNKSTVGIFIIQDGVFKFVNPRFTRMVRYRSDELIDFPYANLIPQPVCEYNPHKPQKRRSPRVITLCHRKDGSTFNIEIILQPLDYHGKPALLCTAEDITQIKRAEEKMKHFNQELKRKVTEKTSDLETANRRLRSLNELKDEFIAVTSHELRSPLTAIRGYLSFIVQDQSLFKDVPDHLKNYLVRVYDNVEVLNNLVNNILDVSRIETGRFELYKKPTDIVTVLKDIIQAFKFQLDEKQLTTTFSNKLPTGQVLLGLDPIRIRQVLRNLVDNAIKYSLKGKHIHFEIEIKGIGVQISVSDEGIGIPKAQIFEVFDKFKQGKNIQSAYRGGAGLGLFIAKKIMELHGGMIWAESQLNKGTTFRLQLPLN